MNTPRRIDIAVMEDGFSPEAIQIARNEAVTLAFTRQVERTCATEVVLDLGDGRKVEHQLPLGQTVLVEVSFAKTGRLVYGCGMDMITGSITVA
jgi:plastocyanin domain-containing protein